MPITKHNHNTPPQVGNEKRNKPEEDGVVADCRCTDIVEQLVQCEWCEMWLCSECEKVPPKMIDFIGKYCKLRIHWFCKI